MLKDKVTKKEILNNYKYVINVPYCALQNLLYFQAARYYNAGDYGWNADIYEIDSNVAIVTGYRPFGSIECDYTITKKYDDEARKILSKQISYDEQKQTLNELLENFVNEIILNKNEEEK